MYYCYVLYSPALGKFYKGQTHDIKARVDRHNSKLVKSTAPGAPWVLCWYTEKQNRSEAISLEMKLKNLSQKRLIQFILKYKDGVPGPDELLLIQQLSGC
jgi:putative endonuclease